MSKEQKFHKLIQEQDSEGKERLWNKIEEQTEKSEQVDIGGGVLAKKHVMSKQNIFIICSVIFLAVLVCIILICKFITNKDNNVIDDFRYCEFGDYYSIDSEESINDYSAANNLNLLYFDWYAEAEYYTDTQYKLNSTDEVICLGEELVDENGNYIIQYITDTKTQVDFLNVNIESCINQTTINSVKINYGTVMENAYAYFTYEDYNYYFKLEAADEDYLLTLLEDLIL